MFRGVFGARGSRRAVIGGALGLAGAAAIGRSAGAQEASPEAGWIFTDVLGRTIELPERPVRVAAVINTAAALWDFGIEPVAVFGWTVSAFPEGDHVAWGRVDPGAVAHAGTADSDAVDVEKLIAANPDLIVTWIWDKASPETSLVGIPPEVVERLEQKAPILVVNQGDSNVLELGRIEELARALGADPNAPELVAQREALQAAEEQARALAAEKSDLSVLFASFGADGFFVAGPDYVGDVGYARELGLTLANEGSSGSDQYWEEIGPEQALIYPADIVYADIYGEWTTAEQLQAHATLGVQPAIAAGQVGLWERDLPLSYIGQEELLQGVIGPLSTAEKVS